jgi:predicted RNase H-like HicB family nuclease
MILDLIVKKTDDGFTAEIPSLKGCESWAHNEEQVLDKIMEIASFYLRIDSLKKLKLDKARVSKNKTVYKLVIDKEFL